MMFLNQLVKVSPDRDGVQRLLADALTAPAHIDGARAKISLLARYTDEVKSGGSPAPKPIPFVTSYFWWLQQPDRWPCMWSSAERALTTKLGWLTSTPDLADA